MFETRGLVNREFFCAQNFGIIQNIKLIKIEIPRFKPSKSIYLKDNHSS